MNPTFLFLPCGSERGDVTSHGGIDGDWILVQGLPLLSQKRGVVLRQKSLLRKLSVHQQTLQHKSYMFETTENTTHTKCFNCS